MCLNDLPFGWVRAIAFGLYLLCMGALLCTVRAFRYRTARRIFRIGLLVAFLSILPSSTMAINIVLIQRNMELLPFMNRILSLPLWLIALYMGLLLAAVIVMHLRLVRLSRQTLSARSVCEGLDHLPDGVCYSLPDGFPKLVNNRMQSICNEAFGTGVTDIVRLDERLKKRDLLPGCTVDEDANNTFLCLPNGETWHLKRRQVAMDNKPLTETIAYDVTERYRDICELRQRNERLAAVNRQMRTYLNNMERIVREREVLSAKTRLHNDLGQSLLAIEAYLAARSWPFTPGWLELPLIPTAKTDFCLFCALCIKTAAKILRHINIFLTHFITCDVVRF